MPKLELRKLCRAEAEKWIDLQRADFRRLGCIGDWFNPYLTMAPAYDAAEIRVLRKMVENGYVYRGLRPVHWCFDCRTALAEAEVEYKDHESPSIYVAFAFNSNVKDAGALAAEADDRAELDCGAQSRQTVRRHLDDDAVDAARESRNLAQRNVRLRRAESGRQLLRRGGAAGRERRRSETGLAVEKRIPLDRAALKALDGQDIFRHPFLPRDVKLMYAEHVTADAGTGLVHTAPGHGYEDFVVGKKYGLAPFTPSTAAEFHHRRRRMGGAARLQGEQADRRAAAEHRRAAARAKISRTAIRIAGDATIR